MSWRDWFKKKRASAKAPSAEYATPLEAIRALLEIHAEAGEDGLWATFEARSPVGKAVIEVAGEQLNFCTSEVDLPAILQSLGCAALAAAAKAGGRKGNDRTLWTVPGATPEQLATVIDVTFAVVFGLGEAYEVEGERHD